MPGAPSIPGRPLASRPCSTPPSSRRTTCAGSIPSQLDEDGAYRVARAYTAHFEPRSVARRTRHAPVVTVDGAAAVEGIADAGADVVELGLVGTEMLYHAVTELGLDGGICVTASHNPEGVHRDEDRPPRSAPGGRRLRTRRDSRAGRVRVRRRRRAADRSGSEDVWPSFVQKVLSFVDVDAIRPLRVVDRRRERDGRRDAPAGARADCLSSTSCAATSSPDGSFPNHEPNPLLPENREFIVRKVTEEGADLGVAYDGDADRCFFVDDTGQFVPGDFATALMAEAVLAKAPGEKVIYDVRASWAVPGDDRTGRRDAARESGRARVHQAAHARRGRRLRRARCPRTTTSASSRRPTPASCRSS